jgi:Domain of unknown function (DUF4396)
MLDGAVLLWFVLAALAVAFVTIDIRNTPESPVLKWGFVLLTAYTGVVGAFLYVLGCREPLPGTHEEYTATHWRQTLGSTMHCVAGDGIGILVGAVLSSLLGLTGFAEVALEYLLGFGFGWTIFQALFMRDAAGGSYSVALRRTFIPELLSMNLLMAGMVPTAMTLRRHVDLAGDPAQARFWFVMSMALLVGFIVTYPMNWWLVANHLKHGMMTVRPKKEAAGMAMSMGADGGTAMGGRGMMGGMAMHGAHKPSPSVSTMTVLSFVALAVGLALALAA